MVDSLIVYKENWIIEKIYSVSDRIRDKITDQTLFEERSIKRVGEYLRRDIKNRDNKRYIIRIINEVASSVIDRNKNEHSQLFSELMVEDNEGDEVEFEPADVLANVESELITKEMIALLAQDDQVCRKILGNWVNGNRNNASISRSLARTFGGNAESHRRRITRFREQCHAQLVAAM